MKKAYAGWLLAGLLSVAFSLPAADVTITVNGQVVAKPCVGSVVNQQINLGDFYAFNQVNVGDFSLSHPIVFSMSGCPVGTSRVTATFDGTMYNGTHYFQNQGTATNVAIELLENRNSGPLGKGSRMTVNVNDPNMDAVFSLWARVVTVNGRPTQGTIETVISVIYTYA
ncbi:fimbrial protein [Enterobacteriaceae bacterium ESL0689]|nr:fimbrial protein [Enterobacteriaceae bacterium ESL0689]